MTAVMSSLRSLGQDPGIVSRSSRVIAGFRLTFCFFTSMASVEVAEVAASLDCAINDDARRFRSSCDSSRFHCDAVTLLDVFLNILGSLTKPSTLFLGVEDLVCDLVVFSLTSRDVMSLVDFLLPAVVLGFSASGGNKEALTSWSEDVLFERGDRTTFGSSRDGSEIFRLCL